MAKLFIENVLVNEEQTNIYIENDKITYIGNDKKDAEKTINGEGKAVLPSLVNGHTHAAMTLFRGSGDDMELQEWLETKIWPREAKLTDEDVYWGTKLACLEMIKSGTTLFNDMYWHCHSAAKAVEEMGIRAVISSVFIDLFDPEKGKQSCQESEKLYQEFSKYSSRIQYALGPHALYTVSEETLRWINQFAKEKNMLVHFHLAETKVEVDDCIKKYGLSPVPYLESIGFLDERLVAAHCVWLEDSDLEILSSRKVKAVHNPLANLKLAVGEFFPYQRMQNYPLQMCLGTDGCASNNNLDMFEELKFAALLHKWKNNNPTLMPCDKVWNLATNEAHDIFGVNAGSIEVGKLADFILVDLNHPQMVPRHNLISNIVYAANGSVVDTVICNGKVVMEDRKVPGEEEIIAKAREVAKNLFSR